MSNRTRRISLLVGLVTLAILIASPLFASGRSESDGDGGDMSAVSFTVAVVEPDIAAVPILAAVESLQEEGYDVDWVEVAEPELAIEGLIRREFDISGETITAALVAIQRGAPITVIGDVVGNAWVLTSQGDITRCADLDGERVGIFSEGAVATAMVRSWINENCSGIEPDYLVLGGSEIRYQALVAGEIGATALGVGEVLNLEQEEGDFNVLANFSEDLSRLRPSAIYANADFVNESPESVQLYLRALLQQHALINDDASYLAELAANYLGGTVDEWQGMAQRYVDSGLFNANALTEENLAYTIDFFEGAGTIEPGLTPDEIANLDLVRAAAASLAQ